MAASPAAARLTELHRLAQARLGAQSAARVVDAWQLIDVRRLDATSARWLGIVATMARADARQSSLLTIEYLRAFRTMEIGTLEGFTPLLADLNETALRQSLVVTGPVRIKAAMTQGIPLAPAVATAQATSAASGMRHVLNAGRTTLIDTLRGDSRSHGWARVTGGKTCAFCAMLAARGGVYGVDTVHFDAHDGCSCAAEPVYDPDRSMPAQSQRWADLWDEAKHASGDTVSNFRRLVDGA